MDLTVEDLRFERDRRIVLDIPSLGFRSRRTTAILGPNGAGKTTLLRLIAALERPVRGRISAAGTFAAPDVRWRRNLAFVFQDDVFLRQTVRANLELALRLRGLDRAERRERISDAAQLLSVTHLLDRRADRLSRGEMRRAGLARALCLRSPLVLLDEPLDGLDAPTYARLLDELPQVLHAFGGTTLLVTHQRDEALRLGQDLVVLIEGRVHASGDKHDVALRPGSVAVATVLGHTILSLDGRTVAVPPGAIHLGPGPFEFRMIVEDIVDVVHHCEIVGSAGGARVHVRPPAAAIMPHRGDTIVVHADRISELAS
ncbi:MAG: ATP-binding cassette domain-containing protein [Vicinamibacterales bacterium]